ncbi:MAG: hypothetical protein C4519_02825 [Desulfobacteraceae bacterium]|nr:MAG: hypothetical protein C4519_02825 [Desulfobacteraceae bacterium]
MLRRNGCQLPAVFDNIGVSCRLGRKDAAIDNLTQPEANVFSKPFHLRVQSKINVWPLFVLLMISACVSPPGPPPESVQPGDAGGAVFQQAEELLRKGAEDQALTYYSLYLGQYPKGRHAAAALQRVGAIYQKQGMRDAAQAFYQSAVEQFPNSPAAAEARLALMDMLVEENRPAEAFDMAARMLEGPLDENVRQKLRQRLTHLYEQSRNAAHAIFYAYLLYKESPAPEKEQWEARIKEGVTLLDGGGIEMLWDRIEDRQIRGYLMYRYAVVQIMQENYDEALELLTSLHSSYPDHPSRADTLNLIQTLTQKLSFAPYTLGCLLPLSGPYQTYGQRALNAVELALSMVQGGENPLPIKLVVEDSGSDDAHAVQAVRKMAQARVGAIIGPINTAPAAAQEAQRLNIPILTFTQKTDITAIGDYVFRHFITPRSQVQTLVKYFINDLGMRKFAVMYPEEPYGNTFMTLFWDEVIAQGGRMVGVESYAPGQTDFAKTIKKLVGTHYPIPAELKARPVVKIEESPYFKVNPEFTDRLETWLPDPVTRLTGMFHQDPDQDRVKGPALGRGPEVESARPDIDFDVLFIPEAPKTAGLILPQLAYYDVRNVYTVGTNLWHSQQLIELARQYAQNTVTVDGFYKDSASEAVRNFVNAYRSIYNTEPGLMEAFAFDTANILFDLLTRPEIRLRDQLRNHLRQIQVPGVTGTTAFAADGEAIKNLVLLRVKGDHFVEIRP